MVCGFLFIVEKLQTINFKPETCNLWRVRSDRAGVFGFYYYLCKQSILLSSSKGTCEPDHRLGEALRKGIWGLRPPLHFITINSEFSLHKTRLNFFKK